MSQTITISSPSYNGQYAQILFKPDNQNIVINLGTQLLPYFFDSSLLSPPREIYGTYTILVLGQFCGNDCNNILQVPRLTPTPTVTITPTRTPTPAPTSTPTPTPSYDPCKVPTPTPTPTQPG